MREIKFRAWHKSQKRWGLPFLHDGDDLNDALRDINYEFMQYTGLKDCNGKEIYEGDIVQGAPGIQLVSKEVIIPYVYDSESDDCLYVPQNWEIIGNIYENPELLKN